MASLDRQDAQRKRRSERTVLSCLGWLRFWSCGNIPHVITSLVAALRHGGYTMPQLHAGALLPCAPAPYLVTDLRLSDSIRSEASAMVCGAAPLSPRAFRHASWAALGGRSCIALRRAFTLRAILSEGASTEIHRRNLPQWLQTALQACGPLPGRSVGLSTTPQCGQVSSPGAETCRGWCGCENMEPLSVLQAPTG